MLRDRMPIRNPDPPSRIPLEQTLDHGGPQKTERDKLRLRRWLAAHPSCPYPITYSVALHQALGIADVQYAGALFQRLSRSGLPENCTTERFYLKAVATKNFRFVRLGPLDEGLPVRAVFMASLLHCVDQLRVDQHRLVDGCIVKCSQRGRNNRRREGGHGCPGVPPGSFSAGVRRATHIHGVGNYRGGGGLRDSAGLPAESCSSWSADRGGHARHGASRRCGVDLVATHHRERENARRSLQEQRAVECDAASPLECRCGGRRQVQRFKVLDC